jgi:hypothetical protein
MGEEAGILELEGVVVEVGIGVPNAKINSDDRIGKKRKKSGS